MRDSTVHLGFEVGTGEAVAIPLAHLVVFGQTQAAGKTTTLEGLICRAGCKAIAFVTKRGEGGFSNAHEIKPYFKERADWGFVQAVLEATVQSKQDFKLPWIMRACEGARTLAAVHRNVKKLMADAKGMSLDMYYVLDNYLELVIPQIATLPKSDSVDLADGLNVMNLDGYSPELQALVIRSVIDWVHKREHGVVTVIPEAWRFLPQGRRSPVRMAAEELVREGAGLKNFVWIDSQDIAGVDKLPLRAAKTWLIGVQRESNELKRNLDAIPAGMKKPKAAEVTSLKIGQFYACWGDETRRVYVQPAWMSDEDARAIAMGKMTVQSAGGPPGATVPKRGAAASKGRVQQAAPNPAPTPRPTPTDVPSGESAGRSIAGAAGGSALKPEIPDFRKSGNDEEELDMDRLERLEGLIEGLTKVIAGSVGAAPAQPATREVPAAVAPAPPAQPAPPAVSFSNDDEARYQAFKARLIEELPANPSVLRLVQQRPELLVEVERHELKTDSSTLIGRIAKLIAAKFLDDTKTSREIFNELQRTGPSVNNKGLSLNLKSLVAKGFLTAESDGYRAVSCMKVNVVEK